METIDFDLKLLCNNSGAKVNIGKTKIFLSKNVNWQIKQLITSKSGYQCMDDLGKYLGVPILHKKVNKNTFNFVIDKVNKRLSG